jgi:hypothetical protein
LAASTLSCLSVAACLMGEPAQSQPVIPDLSGFWHSRWSHITALEEDVCAENNRDAGNQTYSIPTEARIPF